MPSIIIPSDFYPGGKFVRRVVVNLAAWLLLLAGAMAGLAGWWVNQPLGMAAASVDVGIEPGTSARGVAQVVAQSGIQVAPQLLYAWFRISGDARRIKAGSYEIDRGTTPRSLLRKLVLGEEALRTVVLVEGWTFRQVREALARAEQLAPDSAGLSDDAVMDKLGRPGIHAEGRFFPDTYSYSKGSADLKLLARAMRAMDRQLQAAWTVRTPDTALQNADQALILASIVEKETGRAADRPAIAAVFANRLRLGMMLQTDPTVIYGMGSKFDGNLRKKDLVADTPWNTYTRVGLPPTPIAMPGKDALRAAVAPASSNALYFVARGDGSSEFSTNLEAHNRAVDKYQRKP
ncbi:MAG: endolytic transglycosylase MltG [Rhodoferax sp.]|nr:endolytic transglycosylase MltG [Rhodoferax sp.]